MPTDRKPTESRLSFSREIEAGGPLADLASRAEAREEARREERANAARDVRSRADGPAHTQIDR